MNALKMHKYTGKRRQKGTEANDIMEKKNRENIDNTNEKIQR